MQPPPAKARSVPGTAHSSLTAVTASLARSPSARTAATLRDRAVRVTAKRVAAELGVFSGLVSHYFATADELVATAFAHAAANEREQIFGRAVLADRPVDRMRRLLNAWLHRDRDPVSLLWLDGWQASRRRPRCRSSA
jgi:AcrR family transcriptional regulator